MTAKTTSDGAVELAALIARIQADVAALRLMATVPVDVVYGENISFEIRPASEGDRLNVYRKNWGTTCVNYTSEGLILDVFAEESMDCLHTASIESAELEMDGYAEQPELT